MKILLSAASCSPYKGSEPAIGWKVARALAERHEVRVLVFAYHREELERARAEGLVPESMAFHYVGSEWKPQPNPLKEKLQYWAYYREYVAQVRPVAEEILARESFDVIQHVTFATWRTRVPLDGLGLPFVWGPVGGAERFPPALLPVLSLSGMLFELLRYASGLRSSWSPGLRAMIRRADAVVASHPEVTRLLVRLRGSAAGVHELLVTAFTPAERASLAGTVKPTRPPGAPLRAFCGGLLEGRKGVSLAIRAIARAKAKGLSIRYLVSAKGPELEHLRKLVVKLELSDEVIFGEPLRGADYHRALLESDLYLLPSLRDNAPITLMEAMLAGCVPVVADCGGPSAIVSEDCGIKVPVASVESVVAGIESALLALQADPARLERLGTAARRRILEHYTMERYLEKTEAIYREVVGGAERGGS
jgi:glycosyltransferase involved in cell wall biosynthesis